MVTATPPRLNGHQLLGLACAHCAQPLPRHPDRVQELPAVHHAGHTYRLFADTPRCPLPRRQPFAAWPPGRPPATAVR